MIAADYVYVVCLPFCLEKYFELIKERKVKGYLFQEKNYFGEKADKTV